MTDCAEPRSRTAPAAEPFEEDSIVADDDRGPGVVGKCRLAALDGGEVQVVGGLVEHEHVTLRAWNIAIRARVRSPIDRLRAGQ